MVMVKSGTNKRSIENFGNNRYLIKTNSISNEDVNKDVIFMLSRTIGLPEDKLALVAGMNQEQKIFQIIQ